MGPRRRHGVPGPRAGSNKWTSRAVPLPLFSLAARPMGRAHPYRFRAPDAVAARARAVADGEVRMYVVQRSGPLSFVLREGGAERKFRAQLGDPHRCSCPQAGSELCDHLLFVLLRVLRLPPDNALSWQLGWTDAEVSAALTHNQRRERSQESARRRRSARKRGSGAAAGDDADGGADGVSRHPLDPDEVCPICQEDMREADILVWCRVACGKSIHARCMRVWAQHQEGIGEEVTCPLCRKPWGERAAARIAREVGSRQPARRHQGVSCLACRARPVCGTLYRCLHCRYALCERCFQRDRHPHHPFVALAGPGARPQPGARGQFARPRLSDEQVRALQGRELRDEDYAALMALDEEEVVGDYLARLLPDAPPRPQSGGGEDPRCTLCRLAIRAPTAAKRLPRCGHAFHGTCLASHLNAAAPQCPRCREAIFPGLIAPQRPASADAPAGSGIAAARARRAASGAAEPATASAARGLDVAGTGLAALAEGASSRPAPPAAPSRDRGSRDRNSWNSGSLRPPPAQSRRSRALGYSAEASGSEVDRIADSLSVSRPSRAPSGDQHPPPAGSSRGGTRGRGRTRGCGRASSAGVVPSGGEGGGRRAHLPPPDPSPHALHIGRAPPAPSERRVPEARVSRAATDARRRLRAAPQNGGVGASLAPVRASPLVVAGATDGEEPPGLMGVSLGVGGARDPGGELRP